MMRKALVFLFVLTVAIGLSIPPASAQWADPIKDNLAMRKLRTLHGKAFLEHPVSGAAILIYDRSGALLYSLAAATGDDGRFSITRRLPASFTVVISGGTMAGQGLSQELSRYISEFDEAREYKVNAVSTLLAEYLTRHPGVSYSDGKRDVATFLSIPRSIDLDEVIYSSEWYCYYFSHYRFMKAAQANLGMTPFVGQLADEVAAGPPRSFSDGDSVGSSVFGDAMTLLLKGALSETGGQGAGWILGLLTNGGDDTDQRLADMKSDLEAVLNDLQQITAELTALAQQLNLDTNEVETYIEGLSAQDAVSMIKTHYGPADQDSQGDTNTLKYFSFLTSKDVDTTTKQQIAALVGNINGAWDIEDQVQKIHDAIIPDIGDTDGLLDLWTKKFLLQGPVNGDQLMDYYKTLEQYFSVLLFYQFKGANMVVEAQNYQSSLGENALAANGATPAANYVTGTFQPMIKEETARFMKCVLELIANNCGLYWEQHFLPTSAEAILARATFFQIQTLGEDHYGLRAGIFGTKNLLDDIYMTYPYPESGPNSGEAFFGVNTDVSGRPYDAWGTLTKPNLGELSVGTLYTLNQADYSSVVTGDGPWEIFGEDEDQRYLWDLGSVTTKRYTKDYVEDPNGDITYGYNLAPMRIGGKEAMMDPSAFKHFIYDIEPSAGDFSRQSYSEQLQAPDNNLVLEISADFGEVGGWGSQRLAWGHVFTFSGNTATTAYLNIAGNAYATDLFASNAKTTVSVNVGLWDLTTNKAVNQIQYAKTAPDDNQDTTWQHTLNDQISFTLTPGHQYQVYADIIGGTQVSNAGGGGYWDMHLAPLTHLSLTFVNSEY